MRFAASGRHPATGCDTAAITGEQGTHLGGRGEATAPAVVEDRAALVERDSGQDGVAQEQGQGGGLDGAGAELDRQTCRDRFARR